MIDEANAVRAEAWIAEAVGAAPGSQPAESATAPSSSRPCCSTPRGDAGELRGDLRAGHDRPPLSDFDRRSTW